MEKYDLIGTFEGKELKTIKLDDDGVNAIFWGEEFICSYDNPAKIIIIDTNTIEILESHVENTNVPIAKFITLCNGYYNVNVFRDTQRIQINKDLMDIQSCIVSKNNRLALFSYKYGFVTSAYYDEIFYDKEANIFSVRLNIKTNYGIASLFGSLDDMGHLIDDTLYCPTNDKYYLVDEHSMNYELLRKKLEKDLSKQKEHDDYLEFEYQAYLTRKKRK